MLVPHFLTFHRPEGSTDRSHGCSLVPSASALLVNMQSPEPQEVAQMGTQSWTVGGTGSPGRQSLRITAKAHERPECSGLCSKHFAEITSFNSPNSPLRNVLCPHFVNEETEAQRGL